MTDHWPWIHAVLWFEAAAMVWCAIQAESQWKDGRWAKHRVWYVRWCLFAAVWFVYAAGMFVP